MIDKSNFKNQLSNYWVFLALLIAVALFYNYPSHFFDTPQGSHTWRQTDCASLALNYYQDGLNPFKPRIHHVIGGAGYGVGEFPILYYTTAVLYKIFGVHEGIFRLLNLSIFCGGLLALFLLVRDYTKNIYVAYILPLLIWSSPVIGFYSFNFLSDAPALGLSLMGLYNFFRFYEHQKQRYLNLSMFCFAFAGLLKITALIPFVAITGLFGLEFLGILKLKDGKPLFLNKWKSLIPFVLAILAIAIWYYVAIQYNEAHRTNYFSTRTWPYWSLDENMKAFVWERTFRFWYPEYAHRYVHIFFVSAIGLTLLLPMLYSKLEYGLVLLCTIGTIMFFYLWAFAFIDHEYYVINLTYAPILGVLVFFKMLTEKLPKISKHWVMALLLVVFTGVSLYKTKQKIRMAYKPAKHSIPEAYYDDGLKPFLKKNNVKFTEFAISTPDGSPNSTLYHLNLRGWTDLYGLQLDTTNVESLITWGAKYLVVNDTAYLNKPELKPLLKYPIDNFKEEIFLFDLEPFKK